MSSKRTVPLPLRCGFAAGLGMAALQLHYCLACAAAAACTVSMNAPQRALNKLHLALFLVVLQTLARFLGWA